MRLVFWGTRGSIPVPGSSTITYGGNTSCIEIRVGDVVLIFDAGTGIRCLGEKLFKEGFGLKRKGNEEKKAYLFFTHYHWDHIQGFPFFAPLFIEGNKFICYGPRDCVEENLSKQMEDPNFPIRLPEVKARFSFLSISDDMDVEIEKNINVKATPVIHPGGAFAYRIESDGKAVVYATDTEHGEEPADNLVNLSRGADILIYDAMFTPEEYEGADGIVKKGWGHSTWEAGAALAEAARVKKLFLFHHLPERSDAGVEKIVKKARAAFKNTRAAREGEKIGL